MRFLSRRPRIVFTLLVGLLLSIALWQMRIRQTPVATGTSVPQQAAAPVDSSSSAVPAAVAPPAVPGPSSSVPITPRLLTASVSARAGFEPVKDLWPDAQTLAESVVPSAGPGPIIRRVRIVRADFKYPLLRLEETLLHDSATGAESLIAQVAMVADHVLLKAAPGGNEPALLASLTSAGGTVLSIKPAAKLYLVTVPAPLNLDGLPAALDAFKALAGVVAYAEPDFVVHATLTPDDASYAQLYGLHNTGQTGGVADADIDAPEAWEIATGSRTVRVGVIDTGIDYTHPDLAANMWINPGEIAGNAVDDDGNGYVDDVRGWDFANNDANPMDDNLHGTHCAGTIGAVGGNALGVVGVNWQVGLVGLKFLDAVGSGATSDATEAVAYATGLGLDLTSNSWSGGGFSQALLDAITEAGTAGQLFVAAAGNNALNTDTSVSYPSGYNLPNIIAVAATDHADQLASFSNYGAVSVDLAAPGVNTLSTTPGAGYQFLSGTSMATPHVAGAVALMWSHRPGATAAELKAALLSSVDPRPALAGKILSGGRLNLHGALLAMNDLLVTPASGWSVTAPIGGPFPATATTYLLNNFSAEPRAWSVALDVPWAVANLTTGTVPAGGTATVTVMLDPVVAAALAAGTHTGRVVITDISKGREYRRELRLLAVPPTVVAFDLSSDPGWPRTGQWAYGRPAGLGGASYGNPDPVSGHTGVNVFGVNLAGDYSTAVGGPHTLTAGPFDLTGYTATRLQFRRWLNSDVEPWVSATVELSTDGLAWRTLWRNSSAAIEESDWSLQDIDLSAHADNQSAVYLRWTHTVSDDEAWPLSGWNVDDIAILGVSPRRLSFDPVAPVVESAGVVTATLRLDPAPDTALTVSFNSSRPDLVPTPANVTVPAGAGLVSLSFTLLDNALLDGTRSALITPAGPTYQARSLALAIEDDESATLTLALPAQAIEGALVTATLHVSPVPDAAVSVNLSSSAPTVAAVPPTVTVPPGAASVSFVVTCPENIRIDGPRSATLRADVAGWTHAEAGLAVADNESRTLALAFAPGSRAEGAGTVPDAGVVTLGGTLDTDLVVTLVSADPTEIVVTSVVVIPAGALSVQFPVTLPDDADLDGVQTVPVTASAETFASVEAALAVADNDPASFVFDPIPSPQYVGQFFSVRVSARDIDGAPALGFTGNATLSGRIGAASAALSLAQTGAFVAGAWSGPVAALDAGQDWTVSAAAAAASGTSNGFKVAMPAVRILTLATNDLVYDPVTRRIYASTPAGTIVPIDPATGILDPAVTVAGTAATLLARSTDGDRLWVVHDGAKQIRTVGLPALTPGAGFTLAAGHTVAALSALPGENSSFAAIEKNSSSARITVYDPEGPRPGSVSGYHSTLAAGTGGRLYSINNYTTGYEFTRCAVSASGVALLDSSSDLAGSGTVHADGDLVASSSGRVLRGGSKTILASLPYTGLIRPDVAADRVYLLSDQGGGVRRLRSYDATRFAEVGRLDLTGVSGTPGTLLRWGSGGLAFRTPTQVFLLDTALVPTADSADLQVTQVATPNPAFAGQSLNYLVAVRNLGGGSAGSVVLTDTLPAGTSLIETALSQGTLTVTGSQITATLGALAAGAEATLRIRLIPASSGTVQNAASVVSATGDPDASNNQSASTVTVSAPPALALRRLSLGARDIAYDHASDRLLVSLGNTAAVFPNSLLRIDPVTSAAHSADYLGDNPGRLKLTADGRFAWAALDGSYGVARAPIVQGASAGLRFSVGHTGNTYGLMRAVDIAPVTGRPEALAIARSGFFPLTVALYENGVPLPKVTPNCSAYALVDGPSPLRVYGYNRGSSGFDFYQLDMLPDGAGLGVSKGGLIESYSVASLKRAGAFIYTTNGRVIDPEALTLVANLGVSGPVEPSLDDAAFYILIGSTIRAFDLTSRAPLGTLALGSIDGTPTNFVRCSDRSFAFTTSTGQLYLLDAPSLVPPPPLRVVLPARLTEGAGTAPGVGRVEIRRPAAADITVHLTASVPSALDVTRTVVIPAGQTSVTFDVIVNDNAGLSGTVAVTVSASTTATYTPKAATVLVDDDETSALSLTLPASLTEGAAPIPHQATVGIVGVALTDLAVGLSSSDTTELVVPATVIIPAGASSASFTLTAPADDLLDGPQSATVTARVWGYASASGIVQVAESGNRQLTVTLPASAPESFSWVSATLTLPGKTISPLVVSLSSSDTAELTVPATVTVPAGQSSTTFTCTAIDDSRKDGAVTTTVTASAPGFLSGSASVSLIDNDPSSGVWSVISSPQPAGTAFSATLTVKTIDGLVPQWYGDVPITALNAGGAAVLGNAPVKLYVTNGVATASFAVLTAGLDTRLRATLPAPASFTVDSAPFAVSSGAHSAFTFSPLADPQIVGQPTTVSITATDAFGNTVADFTSMAYLSIGNFQRSLGMGTTTTSALLNAIGTNSRTQIIYKASELGGQGRLVGLALEVTTPPSTTLNAFTIRIKPTSLESYGAGATWETAGWTTVYSSYATVNNTGWAEFPFTATYIYNGTDNLLVDISFHNSSSASSGVSRGGYPGGTRAITAAGYGSSGSPLTWSGNTPAISTGTWVPNLRLSLLPVGGGMSSTWVGPFTTGLWSGSVTFPAPGGPLVLRASNGNSNGDSNPFTILPRAPVIDPEPPVTGGTSNTLSWMPDLAAYDYHVQAAAAPGFAAPVSSPLLRTASHTFSPLDEGPWFYRVRTRASVPISVSIMGYYNTPTHDGTTATLFPGSISLANVQTITTETFDGPGTAWSDTIFTDVVSFPGYEPLRSALGAGVGPSTTPALPINQGGDLEAVLNGGTALRPAPTAFRNGTIEAIIAPASPTAGTNTSTVMLRSVFSGTTLQRGYGAVLTFNSNATAKADFAYYANGNGYLFSTATTTFPVSSSDNIRARFSINGSQLSLSLWRLTASGGSIQETPINFASNGGNTLVATDTRYSTAGSAGLRSGNTYAAQRTLFDDVIVSVPGTDYVASGTVTSAEIVPPRLHRWGKLTYSATVYEGTTVAVDILSGAGAVLVPDVPNGADLGAFPELAGQASLRLRARLGTTLPSWTPFFDWETWTLTYDVLPPQVYESAWSPVVSSIQDATAPALAITSPPVSSTASYALTGTATDANGVVALSVNGQPATTADAFGHWSRILTLQPGENILTLIASDPASPSNTRSVPFTVTYTPAPPPPDADGDGLPDAWELAHSLDPASTGSAHGRLGDPDGDGLVNLLEYAFGGNPHGADANFATVASALNAATAQPHLLLTYRRLIAPGALTYQVLTSGDLVTWSESGTSAELLSATPDAGGTTETVVLRLHPALGIGPMFVRIQVNAP